MQYAFDNDVNNNNDVHCKSIVCHSKIFTRLQIVEIRNTKERLI